MLMRTLALAGLVAFVALVTARALPGYLQTRQFAATAGDAKVEPRPALNSGARQIALAADPRGHFFVDAVVNGRQISFMVDTGATSVALTEATARRLNIRPTAADYAKARTGTANGVIGVAPVILDRVRIGPISVSNVQAMVVPGEALQTNLLGMSFLKELRRFEARGDQLVLVQ
jgi:aspartyl protease family protein